VDVLSLSKSTRIRPAVLGPEGRILQEPRQGSSEPSGTPARVSLPTRSPSTIGYEEPVPHLGDERRKLPLQREPEEKGEGMN